MRVSLFRPALLLLVSAATAYAQEFPLAPLIARLPGSTRALALANAEVNGRDADAIYYNPAQLAVARGTDAAAQFYTGANLLVGVSTALAVGPGAIGVGVQSLTFSSASASYATPDALGTRGSLSSSGLVMQVGYGQSLFGLRAGANVKLLEQTIGAARDSRGSMDAGLSRDFGLGTLGVSVVNVGPRFRTPLGGVSQPTRATLGFTSGGYEAGPLNVMAAASGSLLRGRRFAAAGGGEAMYRWLGRYAVALRAGVRRAAEGEGPWTAGLGVMAGRLSLDYAFETRDHRAGAHRIGVRIR
ncbi:MAG: hypothetical protein KGL93_03975 [Gemmatimonadota bacterium]|nr:hypothetical protein [Gemmatimonadota bacterium]